MHFTWEIPLRFIPQTDIESEEIVAHDCHGAAAVSEAIGGVDDALDLGAALDFGYDGYFSKGHAQPRVSK